MDLSLPQRRPTVAQTQAALADLPEGLGVIGETLLQAPGVAADHILRFAQAMRAGAQQQDDLCRGDHDARNWRRLAGILEDAAWRYPTPPRLPATDADPDMARRLRAAGFGTCGG